MVPKIRRTCFEPKFAIAILLALAELLPAPVLAELSQREFDCLMEPHLVIKLGAAVQGVIDRLHVDRGDIVTKGQPIAQLDSAVEEATVELGRARATNEAPIASSRARMDFLRRKHKRAEQLRANSNIAESVFDEATTEAKVAEHQVKEAESNLRIAQLELRRAEAQLEQRIVRASIGGVLVERAMGPGEYRNEQTHIVTIAQIDPLNVEVFVPIAYFGKIRVGTRADVRPEEPVGGTYRAAVTVVDRVLDSASGTYGVRLELPNPDHHLPAGLRCKIRFLATPGK